MRVIDFLKNDLVLIVVIVLLAFCVRYISLMDQGITWDEPVYVHAGITYINNLVQLNFSSGAWSENMEHPTFSKFLYGIVLVLFNGGADDFRAFIVAKTLSALMGTLTCVLVFLIGREFFDRRIGVAAAVILALIPEFVAHNQQAAIDTPLALMFTVTMFIFLVAVKKKDWRYYGLSAASTGLLLDTKFNGLLILPIMAIIYAIYRYMQRSSDEKIDARNVMFTVAKAACFLFVALLTLYMLWPWIWDSPANLQSSLAHWDQRPVEYFLGTVQGAGLIYYPVYFLVTTPTLLLIPFFIGVYMCARSKDLYKYAILLWCFIPLIYTLDSMVQNGMRYLLMVYPAVAIVCAIGLLELSARVSGFKVMEGAKKAIFPALVILTALYLIISLATVFPYYLDYYNALAGGPANVYEHRLFVFGWWGEGLYQSVMYLEHNAAPNATVYMKTSPEYMVEYYGNNCSYSDAYLIEFSNADYVVTNTNYERYGDVGFKTSNYRLVYEATVQGAPIAKVYRNININGTALAQG